MPTSGTHPAGCIAASAEVPPHIPTVLGRGGDTGPPTVHFPGAARGQGLSQGWLSRSMPELSRNRSCWERLECGNGRSALDSSPHRFSKLPQPDVSSCQSGEQQGRHSPCRSGVSQTPCLGRAHFPGSNGQNMFPSVPRSAGAAGSGTGRPLRPGSRLACSPARSSPPLSQAPSCCHRGKGVLAPALCSPSPATQRRAAPRCSRCPQALCREATRPQCLSRSPLCQVGSNRPLLALSCPCLQPCLGSSPRAPPQPLLLLLS